MVRNQTLPLRVRLLRLSPCTRVVAWRQACPSTECGGGREAAQVRADLGTHHLRRGLRDARDAVEQGDDLSLRGVLSACRLNVGGQAGNGLLAGVDLGEHRGQHKALVWL
jgi:hypothetical protein